MNAQTTRRKNLNRKPVGSHWTLTRVVLNEGGVFGFALADDGVTNAYLPRSIIERYGITPNDEGGGFSAPLKPNSERTGEHPWIMAPLIWDDDADVPENTAEEVEEVLQQLDDLPHLIDNIDKAIAVLTFLRGELQAKHSWVKETYDAV